MIKYLFFILIITFISPVFAQNPTYIETFQDIEQVIKAFNEKSPKHSRDEEYEYSNSGFAIGTISGFLIKHPDQKDQILKMEVSKFIKGTFCISLYQAGLKRNAKKYCEK